VESLNAMVAEATILGISQRRIGAWMRRANGQSVSAATAGRIVLGLGDDLERLRRRRIVGSRYAALAADGIWGKYRGGGDAVLVIGIGVRWDGGFDVLDWEGGESESSDVYERLFTRLWERGLNRIELVVGDGSGAIRAAREMVYPDAAFQLCLWHWWRTLKRGVRMREQRCFSRDFWEVYNGLDDKEVRGRAKRFCRRWRNKAPTMVELFRERYEDTVGYLRFPERWRHRVRTVNLAEGFFRHFRRFFNRFPGFQDEGHLCRVLGLYLLAAKPESFKIGGRLLVA